MALNKQIILNALRKELREKEENLMFHKLEIAYYWEICNPKFADDARMQINFAYLNHHKSEARKLRKQLTALRETIRNVKSIMDFTAFYRLVCSDIATIQEA